MRSAAEAAYGLIVEAARRPYPFTHLGVADDVEGRFELLSLHMVLVLRRIKAEGGAGKPFAQKLFDVFFRNMDDQLREMGVGDLTVGKKIRKLAEAFYGRTGAYDAALNAGDVDALTSALARNVYGAPDAPPDGARRMAEYAIRAGDALQALTADQVYAGDFAFEPWIADAAAASASAGSCSGGAS